MDRLWFTFGSVNDVLIIKVYLKGLLCEQPTVLQRMVRLLRGGGWQMRSISELMQDFKGEAKVIFGLYNAICHYRIGDVVDVHHSRKGCHSIHIGCE